VIAQKAHSRSDGRGGGRDGASHVMRNTGAGAREGLRQTFPELVPRTHAPNSCSKPMPKLIPQNHVPSSCYEGARRAALGAACNPSSGPTCVTSCKVAAMRARFGDSSTPTLASPRCSAAASTQLSTCGRRASAARVPCTAQRVWQCAHSMSRSVSHHQRPYAPETTDPLSVLHDEQKCHQTL